MTFEEFFFTLLVILHKVHEKDVLEHYAFLKAYLVAFAATALPDLEHHKAASPKEHHCMDQSIMLCLRLHAVCLLSTATFSHQSCTW